MAHAPPHEQALEHDWREHRIAILAALALLDAQRHALAVDIADLERDDLAVAQAGAVGDGQRRLVLEVPRRGDEARDLVEWPTALSPRSCPCRVTAFLSQSCPV
jgi:hypothetical protein